MLRLAHIYKGSFYVYVRVMESIYDLGPERNLEKAAFFSLLHYSLLLAGSIHILSLHAGGSNDTIGYLMLLFVPINFYVFYIDGKYKIEYDLEKYKSIWSYLLAATIFITFWGLLLFKGF